MRLVSIGCVALALAGCRDETALLVFVDTDIADIDEIRVAVTGTDGSTQEATSVDFLSTPGPIQLTLVPADEDTLGPIRIVVHGVAGDTDLLERSAVTEFEEGEVLYLRIYLYADCAGVRCGGGETCGETRGCEPESVYAEPYEETPAGLTPPTAGCDASCWHDCAGATRCERAATISVGVQHSCAVTTQGGLYCWGSNEYGQVGNDELPGGIVERPTRVDLDDIRAVSAGAWHTCAIDADATLYCWGRNTERQLGVGSAVEMTATAQEVADGVTDVAAGFAHTCFVRDDATLACMGANDGGQLGVDLGTTSADVPVSIPDLDDVGRVQVGDQHTCVTDRSGSAWCWGLPEGGALGNGVESGPAEPIPQRVRVDAGTPLAGVSALTIGASSSLVRLDDGTVRGWGPNAHRELGIDASPALFASGGPDDPAGGELTGFVLVATGYVQACGALDDGSLWCWGLSNEGALGVPTGETFAAPGIVARGGRAAPVSIAVGGGDDGGSDRTHACLVANGLVECWGNNESGQLGVGGTAPMFTPVPLGL